MSSTIHRGQSLQSLSLDDLGIVQIQSNSIDDASTVKTVDSKISDIALDNGKNRPLSTQGPISENQETIEDVRAWAKEASFKLKSFNYKIPGDKGSALKVKQAGMIPTNTSTLTAGIAIQSMSNSSLPTTEKPPVSNITSNTTSATNSSTDSMDVPANPTTNGITGETENKKFEEQEDNQNNITNTTIINETPKKKKRVGLNNEEIDEEDDEEIKLKQITQNSFIKEEITPDFTNITLRPISKIIDTKLIHNDKQSSNIYSFSQLKSIKYGSKDSLSTLSESHDDDHLSIKSEPLPQKKIMGYAPYEHLKKINKTKQYGDYIPEELERYLPDDEFYKILGKTRAEYYTLPLWKQQFLKKRAQLF